ncbi:NAD(P)-binding protein [Durotheca rogersii]|uniref:NAD(P)-binding protein n=1 Tax=Durotheca rogersii TaxID=419775 RepID=UPI0022204126|nr:NAD(P)-binding protein [Durotheca rogersii]KAI5866142.1 NAD(P)-binding protein [Durotheca rogersii]
MSAADAPAAGGTLLITGGGGYVGGQIVRAALEAGHGVRATVRTAGAAARLAAQLGPLGRPGQLRTSLVPDMTDASGYAGAFAAEAGDGDGDGEASDGGGVVAVIHAASPFVLAPDDVVRDLLDPAVRGATAILDAVRRFGRGRVRRVVATSSITAVLDLTKGLRPGYTYTEKDWNPVTWDEAVAGDGKTAYSASKTLAERAMWAWMAEHGGEAGAGFALTTLCPPWVFGPYAHALRGTGAWLSESVRLLDGMLDASAVPAFDFGGCVDGRDLGAAHVAAATTAPRAAVAGRRFLVGYTYSHQRALDLARAELPALAARLPAGTPGRWDDAYAVDGSEAARVLGVAYRPLADTIRDSFVQLLQARELEAADRAKAEAEAEAETRA